MDGRRVPRQGAELLLDGEVIGQVTSGMFAPTLGQPAALALIRRRSAKIGHAIDVDLRGTRCPARVVKQPFYKRPA
jgi:aminomethyltransferase